LRYEVIDHLLVALSLIESEEVLIPYPFLF
jgi:hypothetical protein